MTESLLPDNTDFDPTDIRVNFSDQEADSQAREYTPLPTGKYHCKITDGEVAFSTSAKHNGKPYWKLEFTVQTGPYENRKLWSNVMLFDGALYSLAQLMKAFDYDIKQPGFRVPSLHDLIGRDVVVSARKEVNTYLIKKAEEAGETLEERPYRNEVKGFLKFDAETTGAATSGTSSLLP